MMREFAMHIMDITQNSVRAGAENIHITVRENEQTNSLLFSVADDGCGMSEELLRRVRDPFTTSRTTRKVGLGIPMLEQTCETCGGALSIQSAPGQGTTLTAQMEYRHIDRPPLGDMVNTLHVLALMNPTVNLTYTHHYTTPQGQSREYVLDMGEVKATLEDVPLDDPAVIAWLKEDIQEGITALYAPE
jgi:anti-sigma regulatory factor (Ser/Thr protein kinase)